MFYLHGRVLAFDKDMAGIFVYGVWGNYLKSKDMSRDRICGVIDS